MGIGKRSKQVLDLSMNPEELLQTVPDLKLSENIYLLDSKYCKSEEKESIKNEILSCVKKNNMAPLFKILSKDIRMMDHDEKFLNILIENNNSELNEINEKIEDAKENYGDLEVRNCQYKKLVFYSRIGSKEKSLQELEIAIEKTVGGFKLELLFLGIRIGFFWNDLNLIGKYIKRAEDLFKITSDWERKNRFKVYKALFCLITRNFSAASELFLDSLTTFTAVELISFDRLIFYTIVSSIISIDRRTVKSKLLTSPDILKIALQPDNKFLLEFIEGFYYGKYRQFFERLISVIYILQRDCYFNRHYKYYLRIVRSKAYIQYLEPYESVSISSMAESFGVTQKFLEKDIVTFISSSKLSCTIDKVKQVIICNRKDEKMNQYNELVQKGDLLLNRLQRLTRIIQV
ncbi:proteasome regulatory subunit Rpn7 26S proteasome subunit 6 [Cryptosporidium sp. chipmunk genotype I]|uniref:proteasome regulatory subunit Rpn7 26S proteasome subunit 6 n=1 Tax=Cryptosporidium sp. chipmunk genotype I TaxID=1280935 RepID=UPI003519DECF|nr:proteasome regulatory subunit Rpn7 26S proteasome subunit 6 [Cryptosporidium sp. chipmunk genotype I]